MAKAAKPKPASLLHAGLSPKLSPSFPENPASSSKRKRLARTKIVERMTDERWRTVVNSIANGGTRPDAAKLAKISPQTIDAYLISNVSAYKQLRDATLAWNRREWPTELIEHIFDELALGNTLKGAAEMHGVVGVRKMSSLYRIVRKDKAIREAYDEARELQAESFLDEIIDIADDSSKDRLENGRINHEVVNRSKLKIDTRRFAMGAVVKKRFGDFKHVEHEGNLNLNHIATLTGARKRLEKLRPLKVEASKSEPVLIENETGAIQLETG